jgi:hypothetical protein
MGTKFFPGGKADGGGSDVKYSPPSSAEVKNDWRYTDTPLIRLHSVGMNIFTFLPLTFIWFPYPTDLCNREAGYFLKGKTIFNTSCKSRKLSRCVTFSQNFIPLEL